MSERASVKVISDLKQIKILADPFRQRVLSAFVKEPRTTKQAADFLGIKPTKLYHHVALLEEHGFLKLTSTNPKRGTTEKYFQATANRFEMSGESQLGTSSVFEQVIRSSTSQVLADFGRLSGQQQEQCLALSGMVYLSEPQLEELRQRILDLVSSFSSQNETERRPFRLLTVLAPSELHED